MTDYAGSFCLAAPPYFALLKDAVVHHVRENGARFLKFDGGNYACDDPSHGHLPGRYATERMHDMLIELADAARAEAPDVFVFIRFIIRASFGRASPETRTYDSGWLLGGAASS